MTKKMKKMMTKKKKKMTKKMKMKTMRKKKTRKTKTERRKIPTFTFTISQIQAVRKQWLLKHPKVIQRKKKWKFKFR